MRNIVLAAGAAALLAIPASAEASCKGRRNTGTAIGAVAGGLLGNAVAGRGVKTEGTLLGAGVGAVVGNQVAGRNCYERRASTRTYRSARSYREPAYAARRSSSSYRPVSYAQACRWENRPYYNQWGELVYRPTQVCR
jgi:uncharacterized protein YcfJ